MTKNTLWWCQIAMEQHHASHGKTHNFDWAMLNSYVSHFSRGYIPHLISTVILWYIPYLMWFSYMFIGKPCMYLMLVEATSQRFSKPHRWGRQSLSLACTQILGQDVCSVGSWTGIHRKSTGRCLTWAARMDWTCPTNKNDLNKIFWLNQLHMVMGCYYTEINI